MLGSLQTLVTFILVLGILVFFHELGHFLAAKIFKMRVEEFAFGFGKRLVRVYHDGETEYSIRALPLGGFVRIAGMEIEDAVERRLTGTRAAAPAAAGAAATETTNVALLEQEAAEVDHAVPGGFNSRPVYQRFLVILAGPVFSFLLGWLVLCLAGVTVGLPVGEGTNQVALVMKGSVAAQAGLKEGDTILAIDGAPIPDAKTLVTTLQRSPNKPLRLTVQPLGRERAARNLLTPRAEIVDGKTIGRIGIVPASKRERVSPRESFAAGNAQTLFFFEQLVGLFRDRPEEIGENVGGPIRIFQFTGQAAAAGPGALMNLLGSLSLSLGFFNLLPIPILDGGHLALLTLEGIRGRKLTAEQTQRVLATGLAIIAILFVLIMFNDITRSFKGG